ncbi:MAG: hypothetical protein OXI80_19455 [Caldilineaceae bacterium]|nr:hypothetical protein [Caldilineaceae bacterium]
MYQTHPDRQKKVLYVLKKLGMNYQRCNQCNASEGDPSDLHTVLQTSGFLYIMPDEETEEEKRRTGTITVGTRNHRYKVAIITCKQCGYSAIFDLNILEQHL